MSLFKNNARPFIKAGQAIIPVSAIARVDLARLEEGIVTVTALGETHEMRDFDAFEAVMLLHPAALEGRRLRWPKHAWAFHNLVAHPVMQLLVWLGFRRAGIWLHDATVPKPIGLRKAPAAPQ
jgi:hypothetical protein